MKPIDWTTAMTAIGAAGAAVFSYIVWRRDDLRKTVSLLQAELVTTNRELGECKADRAQLNARQAASEQMEFSLRRRIDALEGK